MVLLWLRGQSAAAFAVCFITWSKSICLQFCQTEVRRFGQSRDPSSTPWTVNADLDLPEARAGHCFLSLGWDQQGDMRDLLVVGGGNKESGPLSTGACSKLSFWLTKIL